MLAGNEREALVAVAEQLSAELGYPDGGMSADERGAGSVNGAMVGILDAEDEALVASLRRGLAKIAAALARDGGAGGPRNPVGAALDGAEMVMRGELLMGNAGQLPALMPAFVFLVALPVADQDTALEISERAGRMLEGALGVE